MDNAAKVAQYYAEEHQFKTAIGVLRDLALKTNMSETFKWMFPTYTLEGKNVIAICKFKKHFGIWFFNGVFMSDPDEVLVNVQEGKTQAMRHWKFYSEDEINTPKILSYLYEAIENERKGLKLISEKTTPVSIIMPDLLKDALKKDTVANKAFKNLSSSSKKEYFEYIASAKQEKTKLTRLQKIIPMIAEGKGLNDRYRK